jgi:hypothetical protein
MKRLLTASCIFTLLICISALVGCDILDKDEEPDDADSWPGEMAVEEDHGVIWNTTQMAHTHQHAPTPPCPQELVGEITFSNPHETSFRGLLSLDQALSDAGVTLDHYSFEITNKNAVAIIGVRFQCVTPGKFTGYVTLSAVDHMGQDLKTDNQAVKIGITVP